MQGDRDRLFAVLDLAASASTGFELTMSMRERSASASVVISINSSERPTARATITGVSCFRCCISSAKASRMPSGRAFDAGL